MDYRGYKILPINQMIGYEIRHTGKGSLPLSLSGSFTSYNFAKNAIDIYVKGKEEVDGETDSSGGSEQVQRRPYNRRKPADNAG